MVLRSIAIAILMNLLAADAAHAQEAGRGAYLAKTGDCTACHTAPGHAAFAGGLPITSPFGTIYSTNITPDPVHGIGTYTLKNFDRAVRHGLAKDGTHLYPAMPYTSFAAMSDEDIRDLYAYFMKDVPPSATPTPPTKLYFPFSQRWGLALWNWFFARQAPFKPCEDRPAEWNRGAYLVQSLGHCGACHTPRNLAYAQKTYADSSPEFLKGAVVDHWFASDLRGDSASGLGRWSEADIASFLKTGHAGGAAALGSMKQVVEDSTQHLSDADRKAIARYLKTLPAEDERATYRQGEVAQRPGAGLYLSDCASCHQASGAGRPPKYPALAGSAVVLAADPSSLIRLTLEGGETARTAGGPSPQTMPAFADKLDDRELGDLLTFLRNSWGNAAPAVTTRDAAVMRSALRKKPAGREK